MRRVNNYVILAGLLVALLPSGVQAIDNSDCFTCHDDKTLTKTNAAGKAVSLFVDEKEFAGRQILRSPSFCRNVVIDRWFLRIAEQRLDLGPRPVPHELTAI